MIQDVYVHIHIITHIICFANSHLYKVEAPNHNQFGSTLAYVLPSWLKLAEVHAIHIDKLKNLSHLPLGEKARTQRLFVKENP